jgi:hypothetical protein
MNHKRKKPKNARAGCLLCKPHKMNGSKPHVCGFAGWRRQYHADADLRGAVQQRWS